MFGNIYNKIEFENLFLLESLLFLIFFTVNSFLLYKLIKKFRHNKDTINNDQPNDNSSQQNSPNKFPFRFYKGSTTITLISYIVFNIVILLLLIPLGINLFFSDPQMTQTYPNPSDYWNDYEKPIYIEYDRPLNVKDLRLNISPETEGNWEYIKSFSFLPFVRKIKFYPKETVYPGHEIMVYLSDVSNITDQQDFREDNFKFHSVDLPTVENTIPENNSKNVQIDQDIVFKLSHKEGSFVEWNFKINHDESYEVERNNTDEIKLKFNNPLKQNTDYIVKIFQVPLAKDTQTNEITKKGESKLMYTINFQTVKAPLITNITPQGSGILTNSNISIEFENDMNKESVENAFSISPQIPGIKSWQNNKKFIFNPNTQFQKNTTYTIKLNKGIKSLVGGTTHQHSTFVFTTIGHVRVVGRSPSSNLSSVNIASPIKITFNQAVDKTSAEKNFSVSPNIEGAFSWSGNTLIFTPSSNLPYSTKYEIKINSGIKSIHGLNSNEDYNFSFITEPKKVVLNVPSYRQVNSKACQLVAARMLLGYKGINKSTNQLYSEIAKDTTPCDAENNVWGNPHIGFVGDINGNHDCASGQRGYGVYWEPVSGLLSRNGVSNRIYRGWNVSSLAAEIEKGHPAMVWWQNGFSSPDNVSWTTPEGTSIYAVNGMHSEVVIGFIGTTDNPTHFIVNDPWRGRRTLDVGYFKALWGYFNNTAIVIY
ncbi:hypothetical protein GF362_06290 [Candidatus Dojkabacteria bacterium]|nr:hypothetical protein [Candidatus Dojkabacteria bacterium]